MRKGTAKSVIFIYLFFSKAELVGVHGALFFSGELSDWVLKAVLPRWCCAVRVCLPSLAFCLFCKLIWLVPAQRTIYLVDATTWNKPFQIIYH